MMANDNKQAWTIVGGLAIVNCVVLGATNCTIGIFIPHIIQAFSATSSRASLSATLFVLAMTITSPLVGWLVDRAGSRLVMVGGVVVAAIGYLCAAKSNSIEIYATFMLLGGAGVGFSTFVPSAFVISKWITHRRGLAFGVLLGGASFGAAIFPPIINWIIQTSDWRNALSWIAISIVAISIPILLLVVRGEKHNDDVVLSEKESLLMNAEKQATDIRVMLRNPAYWLLTSMQVLASLSYMGMYYYVVPYLINAGYSSDRAALLFGALGVASLIGFISFGSMADRFGSRVTLVAGLSICALGALLLLVSSDPTVGSVAAIAFVIFWGGTFNLCNQFAPLLQVEVVGTSNFGLLLGISTLLAGAASSLGPLVTGFIFDATDSYAIAFKICALLMATALIPVLAMKGYRQSSIETAHEANL